MLFCQGDSRNLDYRQRFKDQIYFWGVYNGGFLFRNSPVAMVRDIALLVLNVEIALDVEKAQISVGAEYLATAFLLRLNRRQKKTSQNFRGTTPRPSPTCTG